MQKKKTDNFDYIEMKVFSLFKNISKAQRYKMEKNEYDKYGRQGANCFSTHFIFSILIFYFLIHILKTLNLNIYNKANEKSIAEWTKDSK